tara:strand:- start:6431 stop:6562 length:132 start_codon:yes stop_codon:yes gene_type:complete
MKLLKEDLIKIREKSLTKAKKEVIIYYNIIIIGCQLKNENNYF